MYGKAACPVPRGAGDSTGIWKRYCGTIAKAGGNGENKLLPAVTEGSCLLEQDMFIFWMLMLPAIYGVFLWVLFTRIAKKGKIINLRRGRWLKRSDY
jgi:hypothetical protein